MEYLYGNLCPFLLHIMYRGIRSVWVFCERDYLRIHPLTHDGNITAFTPYPQFFGFIYYSQQLVISSCLIN